MDMLKRNYSHLQTTDDSYKTTFDFVTEKTLLISIAFLISYTIGKFSYLL